MAGNSSRKGATRRPGSKKGATVGTGGQSRKRLEGKGPTPKATDRDHHPAARRAKAAAKNAMKASGKGTGRPSTGGNRPQQRRSSAGGTGSEMVAGRNPVVEALRAGVPAKALYVASNIDSDDRVRESLKTAADAGLPLLEASRTDLDRLTGGAVHQGLVLQVPPYEYAHPDDLLQIAADSGRAPLLVVLDGVTDPRNLGAVVRSVAAFGGHGVIVPERRAAGMTATAWKTSAGAAARTPVARVSNINRAIESLKAAGCFVVGLDAGGDVQVPGLELATEPLVLVSGAEGKGLSRLVRENCDAIASIPMIGGTESLNASVAMGVALYEVARRRAE
ncbi:23S rRNA (guanosine(2251)-2'-O)-methyltransferase RlmB [Kineosporia sp. J2-2]|uniref:23S rRNA (Guanosine(2251)-2'-O)-methyltransferase RlmB n=1 Tax=Kineosporia corallincola TaxID=2835133 RepID=A0ABS5T9C5_9ACTN|nr:23S rRNA (guanosine(2251)-2'-O)-methyltransferase RlmB [Kineosporia corallincola]MBT0767674.1 23S rRNA (guanosine(2251)-2'-O)-methyltransferase RlmB [Kineosporia corallincola]